MWCGKLSLVGLHTCTSVWLNKLLNGVYVCAHVAVVGLPLRFVHVASAPLVLAGTACAGVHVEAVRPRMLNASGSQDA